MAARGKLARWLLDPDPPGLGLEFRPDQVVLARLQSRIGRPEMNLCVRARLEPGAVVFSNLEPNIKDAEGVKRVLHQLSAQAGIERRPLALTLPDSLARVWLQPLPEAPRARSEVEELLRFKLRKTLPFDPAEARLSFESVAGEAAPTFLTGVMHEQVVAQYEQLLESLGFRVGAVEISSLSLLNLWNPVAEKDLSPEADYCLLNIEADYFSLSIVRRHAMPVLVRTMRQGAPSSPEEDAAPPGNGTPYGVEELLRDILPTLIYYREKLGGAGLSRVYFRSVRQDLGDLASLLEGQFEARAEPIDLRRAVAVAAEVHLDEPLASLAGPAAGAARGRAA